MGSIQKKEFLSEVDRELLKAHLNPNGRSSSELLSKKLGIPKTTIQRRRKRLEKEFLQFSYSLNLEKFGWRQTNDGSWRITNPQVRMHVTTPPGSAQWKNVEITGYVKVNSTNITTSHHHQKDIPNDIAWLARGGTHSDNIPCDGTALIGGIYDDGSVGWKKEIWFTGGYTNESAQAKPTDSIVGRWIGWKVVMYNMNNDTAVRMESYLDDRNNNHWVRVTNLTDSGGWHADTETKFLKEDEETLMWAIAILSDWREWCSHDIILLSLLSYHSAMEYMVC